MKERREQKRKKEESHTIEHVNVCTCTLYMCTLTSTVIVYTMYVHVQAGPIPYIKPKSSVPVTNGPVNYHTVQPQNTHT